MASTNTNAVPPALRGAVMNSEFNTASNNTSRNNKKNKNANKTRKNTVRPFVPVRPLVAPAGGGGAVPTTVEAGPVGGLKYTPGYGKIDLIDLIKSKYSNYFAKIDFTDDKLKLQVESKISEKLNGRYIIASQLFSFFPPISGGGSYGVSVGHMASFLVDNHGQRHLFDEFYTTGNYSSRNLYVLTDIIISDKISFDDERYPNPLPDIIIDQIKLMIYTITPPSKEVLNSSFIWNPVAHIENLKKA